jgi:hypothetical protein
MEFTQLPISAHEIMLDAIDQDLKIKATRGDKPSAFTLDVIKHEFNRLGTRVYTNEGWSCIFIVNKSGNYLLPYTFEEVVNPNFIVHQIKWMRKAGGTIILQELESGQNKFLQGMITSYFPKHLPETINLVWKPFSK